MKFLLPAVAVFASARLAIGAQSGPVFPTHRYPTDTSFHLSYRLAWLRSRSNFVSSTSYKKLDSSATFTLIEHSFIPEYQPNRNLSVGAYFTVASAALSPSGEKGVSETKLGDQRLFAEYRFYDVPGASVGGALIAKFPAYSNPTAQDLTDANAKWAILMGDAQTDFTALVTTEAWFSSVLRGRADLGYTYRTEQFGSEIPFLLSLGYANPRIDLDFRIKGSFIAQKGSVSADADSLKAVRSAFASSDFAYSDNPTLVMVQPSAEFWVTPRIALSIDYTHTLFGVGSPYFMQFGFGISFREASARRTPKKTFREMDIGTDQEAGQFQGELQNSPAAPPESGATDDEEL